MSSCPIENIIVVMLENRSYDNMLGGLYMAGNPAPYNVAPPGQAGLNGLTGREWNPNPNAATGAPPYLTVANQTQPTQLNGTGTYYPATTIPLVDPGEQFGDMAHQITGATQSSNPYGSWAPGPSPQPPLPPPLTLPDPLPQMAGFMLDYAALKPGNFMETPPTPNVPDVMNYFTPAQVPVTAWLANHFAVCDQWFASVPTQTFANRAFAHCAAPTVKGDQTLSFIDDYEYATSDPLFDIPSIFYQLDAAFPGSAASTPPNWKVYFHDYSISMLTLPYVMSAAVSAGNVNVATYDNTDWGNETPNPISNIDGPEQQKLGNPSNMSTFMEDLANGTLPMYAFIEPRYSNGVIYSNTSPVQTITPNSYPPNSNHPGAMNYPAKADFESPGPLSPLAPNNPPIDVADGEAFLSQLYNALVQSSYWNKTLLIITYDEHGGLYDHVSPPVATSPSQTIATPTVPSISIPTPAPLDDPAAMGFNYNVFGCRVPTIIVSPYISAGSRIAPSGSVPFDHTSIITTVRECFITPISPSVTALTQRDADAPSLLSFLTSAPTNNPGQIP